MGILKKSKQLNNGYFLLPYALMGKAPNDSNTVKAVFGKAQADVQTDNGYAAFKREDNTRFSTSARVKLGVLHTKKIIFKEEEPKLSYRDFTAKVGHSSKTTSANFKELKNVLETLSKSTYNITAEYDDKPFFLCYEFLFTEELQLEEGQTPFNLCDLEAILVSAIVNNKLNPNKSEDFNGTINNIAKALNVPPTTACALINRLIKKGVLKCYREYIDEKGNTVRVEGEKAKTKKEKTILTVHSRIIRCCNVIYKEYKKRALEKKQAAERDTSKRKDKQNAAQAEPPKGLTDEEKFDEIEKRFVRDKKYLNLTEKYKALKSQSLDALLKERDEAKSDALEKSADDTYNELCEYLNSNGVSPPQLPKKFADFIRHLKA